jgi:hypothetical protein
MQSVLLFDVSEVGEEEEAIQSEAGNNFEVIGN